MEKEYILHVKANGETARRTSAFRVPPSALALLTVVKAAREKGIALFCEIPADLPPVSSRRSQMEQVFDPFFTTKDRTRHSGLGLWISRSIIQEHGGEMTVESPSTPLRAGPSTPLRAGPSTPLRAGPSTPLRAGERGKGTRVHVDLPAEHGSGNSNE